MRKGNLKKVLKTMFLAAMMIAVFGSAKTSASAAIIMDGEQNVTTSMTTYTVTTGDETDANESVYYFLGVDPMTGTDVFPIEITKPGCMEYYLDSMPSYNGTVGMAEISFYADEACTIPVLDEGSITWEMIDLASDQYWAYGWADFEEAGTYYVKITVSSDAVAYGSYFTFVFESHLFQNGDRTLKNKEWTTTVTSNLNDDVYYKVKMTKSGYIVIDQEFLRVNELGNYVSDNGGTAYLTLCNSKKEPISDECYNYSETNNRQVFGVKKGTYFIKVNSLYGYRIKATLKAQSDAAGSSKSKAKTIEIGKTVKGLIYATDKTSKVDWYKFVLPKRQSVKITFKGNVCNGTGGFKMVIVPPSNVTLYGNTPDIGYGTGFTTISESDGTWSKGTWYIKVTKTGENTCGNYSIKVTK